MPMPLIAVVAGAAQAALAAAHAVAHVANAVAAGVGCLLAALGPSS